MRLSYELYQNGVTCVRQEHPADWTRDGAPSSDDSQSAMQGSKPSIVGRRSRVAPVMDPVAKTRRAVGGCGTAKVPRQQRHTARRVLHQRLLEEHESHRGGGNTMRALGSGMESRSRLGSPGGGGGAAGSGGGARSRSGLGNEPGSRWPESDLQVKLLRDALSVHSAKPFVRAYPWERQEMFFDAHRHAFTTTAGSSGRLVYDNLTQSSETDPAGQEAAGSKNGSCRFGVITRIGPGTARPGQGSGKRRRGGADRFCPAMNFLVPSASGPGLRGTERFFGAAM